MGEREHKEKKMGKYLRLKYPNNVKIDDIKSYKYQNELHLY